jgi:hypothetical protein
MRRIDSIGELRRVWTQLVRVLQRDLVGAGTLSDDPVGTFRHYGYVLSPTALSAFLTALP